MKYMYLLTFLLLVGLMTETTAQSQLKPGFKLTVSASTLEVKAGTTAEFTVNLERSKSYAKGKAKLFFNSALPEGITITFSPAEGVFTSSTATVTVPETAKPGTYQLILNADINREVKGTIMTITVLEKKGSAVVSSLND
jgi:uncharacterized membrane protein